MKAEDRRKLWQEAVDDLWPGLKDDETFNEQMYLRWLEEKVQQLRGRIEELTEREE